MPFWIVHELIIVLIYSAFVYAIFITPTFLFIDEDWPLEKALPVTICPTQSKLKILSGDPKNSFQIMTINQTCATLKLKKSFDADMENADGTRWQSFSLVLGNSYERENLEIQIIDVNDNIPIFQPMRSYFNVSENAATGTAIGVVKTFDPDTGIGGVAKFFIEDDRFSADKSKCSRSYCTSTIRIAKPLDFESEPVINTTIVVQDGAGRTRESNEAKLPIKINVLDEQDMPPVFENDVSEIIVDEKCKIGEKIFRIRAIDGDKSAQPQSRIRYSISDNNFFDIETLSGWIILKKDLNQHSTDSIKIIATEESDDEMWTEKEYKIRIVAVDDNQPACDKELYQFSIVEGDSDFIIKPLIHVYNKKQNAIFFVSLVGEYSDFFAATPPMVQQNASLALSVKDPSMIDYESIKQINITMILTPLSNSTIIGNCAISVEIVDKNDNIPKFQSSLNRLSVMENKLPHAIESFAVVDADSDLFSKIVYRIVGYDSDNFTIDQNGTLFSNGIFDRENKNKYYITIEATDDSGKGLSISRELIVEIADENDNAPKFSQNDYKMEFNEESQHRFIVQATDADEGNNGMIKYSLVNNTHFGINIDQRSGEIQLPKFDAESMEKLNFTLKVKASDMGVVSLHSYTYIQIFIKDINDNAPIFLDRFVIVNVSCNFLGTIAQVKAFDFDRTTANNQITYIIDPLSTEFHVDPFNGNITMKKPFNNNNKTFAQIEIVAKDNGVPQLYSKAQLFVHFKESVIHLKEPHARVEIFENATTGTTVYEPVVINPSSKMEFIMDELINVTWTRQPGKQWKWLNIDRHNGSIYLEQMIDGDMVDQLDISFVVIDKEKSTSGRGYLSLIINDVNDNWPKFELSDYTGFINKNASVGQAILNVKAIDLDKSDHIRYSLVAIDGIDGYLSINNEGDIALATKLDYKSVYLITSTVLAKDEIGNVAAANVSIFIMDINSNIRPLPEFRPSSIFEAYVEESAPVGTKLNLSYPMAYIGDSRTYGQIKYSLVREIKFFAINSLTSEISLKKQIDFEQQKIHSLIVKASVFSRIGNITEAFASVKIYVLDVNDNPPRFFPSELPLLMVAEDKPIGSTIIKLNATDLDSGKNGEVSFYSSTSDLFTLSISGVVTLSSPLFGKARKKSCFTVVARDHGLPHLQTSADLCILIVQAEMIGDDLYILWPEDSSIHYFDENTLYEELLTLNVTNGKRLGIPANVNYSFVELKNQDWKQFDIDNNGKITAKKIFNFEEQKLFELKIKICISNRCTQLNIFIAINDLNDFCPEFKQNEFKMSILENIGTDGNEVLVGTFPSAVDMDGSKNHRSICYKLNESAERQGTFFLRNISSNNIFTRESFDRERIARYNITVMAFDCKKSCKDSRKSVQNRIILIIDVEDVNDNFPRFQRRIFHSGIIQGHVRPGDKIMEVRADDADTESNGLIYEIKGIMKKNDQVMDQDKRPFELNSSTGEIYSNSYLETGESTSFSFYVTVIDNAHHEDEALVTISVIGYEQQIELIFDRMAPITDKDKENIEKLLSEATSLTAVIDSVVPSVNLSILMVHFLDNEKLSFTPIENAIKKLEKGETISEKRAKQTLQKEFGLRKVDIQNFGTLISVVDLLGPLVYIFISLLLFFLLLILIAYCRQKHRYSRRLKAFTSASYIQALRTPFASEPSLRSKDSNPLWKKLKCEHDGTNCIPTLKTALQSTEL